MKKTVLSLAILVATLGATPALAQQANKHQSTRQQGVEQKSMDKAMKEVEQEQQKMIAHASSFAQRFEQFAKKASSQTDVSDSLKAKNDSIYQAYLEEYRVEKDSLSDEDVRRVSKAKVLYQKGKVRNFTDKTSEQVVDAADSFGDKVSKVFKKTKKKVQGAIDALKD